VAHRPRGVDYDSEAEDYEGARGRSTGTAAYRERVRREVAHAPPGCVIDVGSGTGIWSALLASWSGRPVVAVEPSSGMRQVARSARAVRPASGATEPARTTPVDAPVHLVGGRAGALPVRDGAGAAAWLSTVIHHVGDLDACARDLGRALAPGAPVLIRGAFPGRYEGIPMVRYFPGSRRALDRFPSVEAVREAFGRAGFGFVGVDRVEERLVDHRAWREVLPRQRRADTALVDLTDDEFAAGLRAVDEAIAAGRPPEPIALDLMVLRR
jgi:SAM-dependent methyltransferase